MRFLVVALALWMIFMNLALTMKRQRPPDHDVVKDVSGIPIVTIREEMWRLRPEFDATGTCSQKETCIAMNSLVGIVLSLAINSLIGLSSNEVYSSYPSIREDVRYVCKGEEEDTFIKDYTDITSYSCLKVLIDSSADLVSAILTKIECSEEQKDRIRRGVNGFLERNYRDRVKSAGRESLL